MSKGLAVLVAVALVVMMAGCGKSDESLAQKAGRKLSENVTDFGKGVGKGFDTRMVLKVTLSPEAEKMGITTTVAKVEEPTTEGKTVAVYVIAGEKLATTLVARAINSDGLEVGRAKMSVAMEKTDANYVNFVFPKELDTALVDHYEIGVVK